MKLNKIKKVHFIGVGGIGVSAIARMMSLEGKEVSGSDQVPSRVTTELGKLGVIISIGHQATNIPTGTELVIYSIAVPPANPEFAKAKELNIPMITYPEALGLVSLDKFTIAVAGTHGKTTTTAMIAQIFMAEKLDPTVIVGSFLKGYESNFIAGQSKFFIAEACEYKRSFLNLHPQVLVITNIEADHLDYYRDLADIQEAFRSLAERVPADGFIICDSEDDKVKPVIQNIKAKIISSTEISTEELNLRFPGDHFLVDAKMALAVAEIVGVDDQRARSALSLFEGTWRRFDYKGETAWGTKVYDDYAHHPDEIKATYQAIREKYPTEKLTAVFQPHLYSRTKEMLEEFIISLKNFDQVVVVPIYAAREKDDGTISGDDIVSGLRENKIEAVYIGDFDQVKSWLLNNTDQGDIILVMGAGDISEVATNLV